MSTSKPPTQGSTLTEELLAAAMRAAQFQVLSPRAREFVRSEMLDFFSTFDEPRDLILMVLRFHLVVENLLERLILGRLPRGDRLIDGGNLSFAQKVVVVEALDVLPDRVVQSIKKMNKLRNDCSHQKGKQVTAADIESIGRPLGKAWTQMRTFAGPDLGILAGMVVAEIYKSFIPELVTLELDPAGEKQE